MVTAPLAQPVPLQPAKVEPAEAVAIKVTRVPLLKVAEQVLPQLMPVGVLVTVPSRHLDLYHIDGERGPATRRRRGRSSSAICDANGDGSF